MRRTIGYLAIILLSFSCVSSSKMIKEDVLYKTKTYVGKYEGTWKFNEKFYNIQTSEFIFTLKEDPNIPEGALCYMRLDPIPWDMHPDIAIELTPKYFSWNGSEREYRIYNDVKKILYHIR